MSGDDKGGNDDAALWAHLTRDVVPLKKDQARPSEDSLKQAPATKTSKKQPHIKIRQSAAALPVRDSITPLDTQLDRRTDARLRRGQMQIEAYLDLHGLTQTQALDTLIPFIQNAQLSGKRCVLVITGKGQKNRDPLSPEQGILKQRLPEWLATPPLKSLVLKAYPAKPKDGGSGAYYVLLRRSR